MSRRRPMLLIVLCLATVACDSTNPDLRMSEWEGHFERSRQATAAGEHDEAIAVAEAFLEKYPDNVDGHLMLGNALTEAGRAASDARRPARFTQAVTHNTRVLELSKNPMWRLLALTQLVQLHDRQGLSDPAEAERFARMLIAEKPDDINHYQALVALLKEARKYNEVAAVLGEAKGAMSHDHEGVATYGVLVHDLVVFAPDFPRDTGRPLLAEATALANEALARSGPSERLLRTKGSLLRAQADLEPDRARQHTLQEEAARTFEALDRLTTP